LKVPLSIGLILSSKAVVDGVASAPTLLFAIACVVLLTTECKDGK